jgi:hypothetical protein
MSAKVKVLAAIEIWTKSSSSIPRRLSAGQVLSREFANTMMACPQGWLTPRQPQHSSSGPKL